MYAPHKPLFSFSFQTLSGCPEWPPDPIDHALAAEEQEEQDAVTSDAEDQRAEGVTADVELHSSTGAPAPTQLARGGGEG